MITKVSFSKNYSGFIPFVKCFFFLPGICIYVCLSSHANFELGLSVKKKSYSLFLH